MQHPRKELRRPELARNIAIQDRDIRFLLDLFDSRFTTIHHAAVLHYGSEHVAKRRLRAMERHGLLDKATGSFGTVRLANGESKQVRLLYSFTRQALLELISARELPSTLSRDWTVKLRKRFKLGTRDGLRPRTIDHELGLLDIKTAFLNALRPFAFLYPATFTIWPDRIAFPIPADGRTRTQKPDGFLHLLEFGMSSPEPVDQHFFYIEFDRGNESLSTLVNKAHGYRHQRKSGNFDRQFPRMDGRKKAVRTLFVFDTNAPIRLTNFSRKLAQNGFARQIYLATLHDFVANPLGPIWNIPTPQPTQRLSSTETRAHLFPELSTSLRLPIHTAHQRVMLN